MTPFSGRSFNWLWILILFFAPALPCQAKIDLVTLPERQAVEITIYKNADLTLVRDSRVFRFAKGINRLQFSWANTRIDPTSLSLESKDTMAPIKVVEMSYPPDTKDLGIWTIQADQRCQVRMDIVYFTSGLFWQSDYTAFLSTDARQMDLNGHIRVTNRSGEDYARAKIRLVVGKLRLLDEIALLAARSHPFGRPDNLFDSEVKAKYAKGMQLMESAPVAADAAAAPRKIGAQAVSDYFLYTIEGEETIADGWSRQLLLFEAKDVAVTNTYVFEQERFGSRVMHHIAFQNRRDNHLGITPLPGGAIKVFQNLDEKGGLSYRGAADIPYVPVGKAAVLNLGQTPLVKVTPRTMAVEKADLRFDTDGNLIGFNEIRDMRIDLSNYSPQTAALEIIQNLGGGVVSDISLSGRHEKKDQDTMVFFQDLGPGKTDTIHYRVTRFKGE